MIRITLYALLIITTLCLLLESAYSHEADARGSRVLGWQTKDVARVVSFTPYGSPGSVTEIAGQKCITGYQFYFDVLDNLAFDLDETVELSIRFDLKTSARQYRLEYDKSGGSSSAMIQGDLPTPAGSRFHVEHIVIDHARFAGRGDFGTDFRVSALDEENGDPRRNRPTTTICDISIERSFSTPQSKAQGWLNLTIRNELGETTPARVAVFDKSRRMPLPELSALEIKDFSNRSRSMLLPEGTVNWPSENRQAFYVDGQYRTRLPAGSYTLIATKGIEYRYAQETFTIRADDTLDLAIELVRWANMPAEGWTSGDVHVHIPRRSDAENHSLWLQAQGEDLHITNSLQMGNIEATHFPQSFWGKGGRYGKGKFFIVAGQEDPRTAVRGHTIHLNMTAPVRNSARYLLYHEAFEKVSEQGGISGYGHLDRLGVRVGMALDVPYGHVKFIEVLQRGEFVTDVWFEFLNLGFKIAPAAGSDVPYGARIGDVRSYVKVSRTNTPDSWFSGLSNGKTFATNGPIIEFKLNELDLGDLGDNVHLARRGERINLAAKVSINPDIDSLDRIELIEQGDVIRVIAADVTRQSLSLSHEITAEHSSWFVIRAYGKRQRQGVGSVAAVSAPIYVSIDGERTWKRDEVGTIANKMKTELDDFAELTLGAAGRLDEWFETENMWKSSWATQNQLIQERIEQVKAEYDKLIKDASEQ